MNLVKDKQFIMVVTRLRLLLLFLSTYRAVWMTGEKTKSRVPQSPAMGHAARRMVDTASWAAARVQDLRMRRRVVMVDVMSSSHSILSDGCFMSV